MISPIQKGFTRVLDAAIAEERKQYALERNDFHSFFPEETVRDIQRILRERRPRSVPPKTRGYTVQALLGAQRTRPHRLWRLLLLQAFERDLLRRRRALSQEASAVLDQLVVETFLGALEAMPYSLYEDDLRAYVLTASRKALDNAIGRKRTPAPKAPPPPASRVSVVETVTREGSRPGRRHAVFDDSPGNP
jgi:hypothetical protein